MKLEKITFNGVKCIALLVVGIVIICLAATVMEINPSRVEAYDIQNKNSD